MSGETGRADGAGATGASTADASVALLGDKIFGTERAKAFIDAVVAIAMTLLILPLVDAVVGGDAAADASTQPSAADWLGEHSDLLFSFALSFVVIAMFWIGHHRMFAHVRYVTTALLWITMAWLATIVWLPVVTAMSDKMSRDDGVVIALYIGTMAATSLLSLVQRLYLHRHPALHDMREEAYEREVSADIAMAALFLISLALAVSVPAINYYALFLLGLTGRGLRLVEWMLFGRGHRRRRSAPRRRA